MTRILKNASFFLSKNYHIKKENIQIKKYIPINDFYFDNSLIKEAEYFKGNHFNIEGSIKMIHEHINNN